MSPNESWKDIISNDGIANFDVDTAGAKGYGFVRLQQLAVEHLMGAR